MVKVSTLTGALLVVAGVKAIPSLFERSPWIPTPGLEVNAAGDGVSDGVIYPDDSQFGQAFIPLGRPSSKLSHLPSTAPFRGVSVTRSTPNPNLKSNSNSKRGSDTVSGGFLKLERKKQTKRYITSFIAPSGYTDSWAIDGYRLAIVTNGAPSYLTRTTISKDATRTTQEHVDACVQFCEKTQGCAMAHLIKFINFPEGTVICAAYAMTLPKSEAKYTKGLFNGPGEAKFSYTFNRNAGKVQVPVTTTTSQSVPTSSSAATMPTTTSSISTLTTATTTTTSSSSAAPSSTLLYDQWQWIDVPGTFCSDGSQTGFALNLHPNSTELVIGYQEGGSCYDYNTCYVQKRAYNMQSGFTNSTFFSQNQPSNLRWWFPFARNNQYNPWIKSNYAWIPYCTGDLHGGDNIVQYSGATKPTYHKGFINGKLDMIKLSQILPNLKRVWISGSSAGAFGSILQYQNAQDAFAGIRIDLLADSGESPKPITVHQSQNIQVPNKSRCPNCNDANFNSYIVGLAQSNPGSRFASMSWSNDTIIPVNQGVSYDDFRAELVRLFNQENTQTTNARNFMVQGSNHVLLYTTQYNAADGYTQATFLNKFKTDDPNWSSH
ncbi:uncharacterized protein UTRI_06461 [Ustilago trichophora]|uniref:Pectinacetylesterase n=1 Tax=Ustilago trichophora TaxID=86804 RepID=A0A5C3ELX5_9BASI|nr:uncharacterized protein UTRI_06461 [Ustilago trichophora]